MNNIANNLKRASIEMILLSLLLEEDKYGYQMAQEIKKRTNGQVSLLEGSMYPVLNRLKEYNDVVFERVAVGEKSFRVYYHITEQGKEHLSELINTYTTNINAINNLLNI